MKLLVILGSTSTGKTDLVLKLAKKFNGEIIACDSRQVYKKLDIGTGKMPGEKVTIAKGEGFWWLDGIKVWMYDVVDPKKQYNVADYIKDTNRVIEEIFKRDKLPIIVGGTGLYLKALLQGLPNLAVPINLKLRKELESLSLNELQARLQQLALKRWKKMNNSDRQNPRRLVRALEIVILSGTKDLPRMWDSNKLRDSSLIVQNDVLKIGLTAPRHILYQKIDERVIDRINQGMIEEAKKLHEKGLTFKRMRKLGLEYGVLADYLEGKITSKNKLVKILQGRIHGFARRQITWFKKEKDVFWFDIVGRNFPSNVEKAITKWYYQPVDDTKD